MAGAIAEAGDAALIPLRDGLRAAWPAPVTVTRLGAADVLEGALRVALDG